MNRRSLFRAAFGALALPVVKILPAEASALPPVMGTRKVHPGVWVKPCEVDAIYVTMWAGGAGGCVGSGGGRKT